MPLPRHLINDAIRDSETSAALALHMAELVDGDPPEYSADIRRALARGNATASDSLHAVSLVTASHQVTFREASR